MVGSYISKIHSQIVEWILRYLRVTVDACLEFGLHSGTLRDVQVSDLGRKRLLQVTKFKQCLGPLGIVEINRT